MDRNVKIFSKKMTLSRSTAEVEVISRPGGWWVAQFKSPSGEILKTMRFQALEARDKFWLHLNGRTYQGEKVIEQYGVQDQGGGDRDLVAQFPGKVRKVLVAEGATVQEGQTLLLVEAMKMEFTIKAPAAGTVKKVLVTEGQQLLPGQQLIDVGSE